MRSLQAAQNVDPIDADYPRGKVRDKDGATAGTTTNEVLFGDLIQFFQKLVVDASITENGLPDNVTNGYQLMEALVSKIRGIGLYRNTLTISTSGTYTPSTTEDYINITAASGVVVINIPDPALHKNRIIRGTYANTSGDGSVISLAFSTPSWGVVPGGFTVPYYAATTPSFNNDLSTVSNIRSFTLLSNGTSWEVLSIIINAVG